MPSDKDIKPTAAVKPTAAQLITYWAEQNRLLKDEVASLKALLSDASAAKFKELSDHMKSLQAQVEGSGYMDVWAVLHKEQDAKAAQCQELKDKVKTLTAEVEAWVNQEIWVNHGNNTFTVKREPDDALRRRVNLSRLSPLGPLPSPRVEEIWINHRTNKFTVKGEPGELSDTASAQEGKRPRTEGAAGGAAGSGDKRPRTSGAAGGTQKILDRHSVFDAEYFDDLDLAMNTAEIGTNMYEKAMLPWKAYCELYPNETTCALSSSPFCSCS